MPPFQLVILEVMHAGHKFCARAPYRLRRRVCAMLAALALVGPAEAHASECRAVGDPPPGATRDGVLLAANADAAAGRYPAARGGYLWILARRPEDAEALYGLARVDAWDGCLALAQSSYARILDAHPDDDDVRAGFVDVLVWRGKYDEAERLLERGLERRPRSAPLLLRSARLAYWRGETQTARALLDAAGSAAPDDPDVAEARARTFASEARVSARLDTYPSGYPDVYTTTAQALHRLDRLELQGGLQLVRRTQTSVTEGVTDVRYPLGVLYHTGIGSALGLEVTPAAPSNAVPDLAVRASVLTPLVKDLSAFVAYSFWHYGAGPTVHILNPSLGITLPADIRLDLRAWLSALRVPGGAAGHESKIAAAGGASVAVPLRREIEIGGWYTYGVQLDRNPALLTILPIESHSAGAFADLHVTPRAGLRPLVGAEHRSLPSGASLFGASLELGAYLRW